MSHVRQQNTSPEVTVRRLLHRLGYRFRLHRRDLPGTPDIVLPCLRTVIFVHGCFWHSHPECPRAKRPDTNRNFWSAKLDRNIARDSRVEGDLQRLGWQVMTVWQCEVKNEAVLTDRLLELRRPLLS